MTKTEHLKKLIDELVIKARTSALDSAEKSMLYDILMDTSTDEMLSKKYFINEKGVKYHKKNIAEKLGIKIVF